MLDWPHRGMLDHGKENARSALLDLLVTDFVQVNILMKQIKWTNISILRMLSSCAAAKPFSSTSSLVVHGWLPSLSFLFSLCLILYILAYIVLTALLVVFTDFVMHGNLKNLFTSSKFINLSWVFISGVVGWSIKLYFLQDYQFWTKADEGGYFSINNVRTGNYNLYAWVPGFVGDYRNDPLITIIPGRFFRKFFFWMKPLNHSSY